MEKYQIVEISKNGEKTIYDEIYTNKIQALENAYLCGRMFPNSKFVIVEIKN